MRRLFSVWTLLSMSAALLLGGCGAVEVAEHIEVESANLGQYKFTLLDNKLAITHEETLDNTLWVSPEDG